MLRLSLKGTLCALALVLCSAAPSMAATLCTTITSTDDSASAATTPGTLRYAIAQADGLIGSSCDTISFSLNYPATITLVQGQFVFSNPATSVSISGPGAANLTIADECIQIDAGATVSISGVTLQNGSCPNQAGTILNNGTLTLSKSTISGGFASFGGAIQNLGTATVTDSTLSDNRAHNGNAIYNYYNATLTVSNSTFSGNSVIVVDSFTSGGAIQNFGTATVTNSTFSGNSSENGGAISNDSGTMTVTNSTFSGNNTINSLFGGGALRNNGTLTVQATLLANGSSGGNCTNVVSAGYNLSDDNSCGFGSTGDLNNTAAGLDPAGLQDNGGPTQTIALITSTPASPALDAIPPAACAVTTDQRGVKRPQGSGCDIGAFEATAAAATLAITGQASPTANSYGWNNTSVTVSFQCSATPPNVVTFCTAPTTLSAEGANQSVTGTVTDNASNTAQATVVVNIDETNPTITYTGGGTYTIDQTVNVTCTASDALSGIASSTCTNVSGPAYSFSLGDHTCSATATDKAGNTGSGSTSFTITVGTPLNLANIVPLFEHKAGVANAMTSTLRAAYAAFARGNNKAGDNILKAFINQLKAQSGKSLTPDVVAVGIEYALAMMK